MYKPILFAVAIVCLVGAFVEAGPNEDLEVKDGMRRAFSEGMERFGGAIKRNRDTSVPMPTPQSSKVFSLYTQGLKARGGGKPSVLDQYREHHYTPLAPVIAPKELPPITGKMTAADAAARYKPGHPIQFATENF